MTEGVDLTDPETKIKSMGKKKRNIWTKSSSKQKESAATTPRRVEPKIWLSKGKRSNIDFSATYIWRQFTKSCWNGMNRTQNALSRRLSL